MLKNPCTPNPFVDENKEKYQQYRYFVISRLPKLQTLDAEPVKESERKYVAQRNIEDIKSPLLDVHQPQVGVRWREYTISKSLLTLLVSGRLSVLR